MAVLFSNNATTTLSAGVSNSATSITVTDGSVFPSISGSDYFYATLEVHSNPSQHEIVRCTARSGNTLTIVRAQDGTSARTFSSGDTLELRLNAAALNDAVVGGSTTEILLNQFTGDGSTTAFTLSNSPDENLTSVFLSGVYQSKSNYSVSGTTLTFSTAPPNGLAIEVMVAKSVDLAILSLADGTVSTQKIADGHVTMAKLESAVSSKINGIEDNATADQTAAEIKTAYESNTDTNAFTDADHTKLDAIEDNATADQTATEIKTAYESNSDTNAFTDADHTKLDGIAAGAEVNIQSDWNATTGGAQILNRPFVLEPSNNLSDVANAATACTNLGLGTAAMTDVSDYATAAQGAAGSSALTASTLNGVRLTTLENAGYISDITTQTDPKYLRSDASDTATGEITFSDITVDKIKFDSTDNHFFTLSGQLFHFGNDHGYFQMGIVSSAQASFLTDADCFVWNKPVVIDGGILSAATTSTGLKLRPFSKAHANGEIEMSSLYTQIKAPFVKANAGFGSTADAYFVRAWARLEQSGTHSFRAERGFSSIDDEATGRSRVHFDSNMPDSNYAVCIGSGDSSYTSAVCSASIYDPSSSDFYFTNEDLDGGHKDNNQLNIIVVR